MLILVGIAGSVTTFSSWMLESFLAFSNESQYNRGGLHDVRVSRTSPRTTPSQEYLVLTI